MGRIFIVDEPVDEDLDYVERKLIRREARWFDEDRYGYMSIHSNYIPIPKAREKAYPFFSKRL